MRRLILLLLGVVILGGGALAETVMSPSPGEQPDIAWDGTRFGIAYSLWSNESLAFMTFDPTGTNPGAEMILATSFPTTQVVIVRGQGAWCAAWAHQAPLAQNIFLGAFDDTGSFIFAPVQLSNSTNVNLSASYPSLVWTGMTYEAVWQRPTMPSYLQTEFAAVDAGGTITIPWRPLVPGPGAAFPKIAWDAATGSRGAAWYGTTMPPKTEYYGANVSSAGAIAGSAVLVSPPPAMTRDGQLGVGAGGFAFGCRSDVTSGPQGQGDLYFTMLDANMDVVTGPTALTTGQDNFRPGNIIWTNVGYVWPVEHFEPGGGLYQYVFRVDPNGNLLGVPVRLSDQGQGLNGAQWGPRGAFANGNLVGIVWQDDRGPTPYVYFEYLPTIEVLVGGGSGPGNPAQVKSLSAFRGETVVDFAPYSGGYGANVAAANINTSSFAEVLTGPGPGPTYGPLVRAFTGAEQSIAKVNFFAYGTMKYGAHVAGGDLDGDGMAEIVTGAGPGAVFGPHVRGWNFDGARLQTMPKVSFYAYSTLKYGVEAASGDVDADGYHEIITGPGPGSAFGAHLRGFNYDNTSVAAMINVNAFVFSTKNGLMVGAGDLDADGRDEVVASAGPDPIGTSEVRAYSLTPSLTQIGSVVPFTTMGGSHIGLGDMTLTGGDELATTPGFLPASPGRTKTFDFGTGVFQSMAPWDQDVFPGLTFGATCAIGNVGI